MEWEMLIFKILMLEIYFPNFSKDLEANLMMMMTFSPVSLAKKIKMEKIKMEIKTKMASADLEDLVVSVADLEALEASIMMMMDLEDLATLEEEDLAISEEEDSLHFPLKVLEEEWEEEFLNPLQ
jgi:hypothetical protein